MARVTYAETAKEAWRYFKPKLRLNAIAVHLGIQYQLVYQWVAVPDRYLDQVSSFYKIPKNELRPDLYGSAH